MAKDGRDDEVPVAARESVGGDLAVGRGVVIPARELSLRVSRAGGPGGQRTNKVATRVSLSWTPDRSDALDADARARLRSNLRTRLNARGELVVHASSSREQSRNRAEARRRLGQIVTEALAPPAPPRRATRPTKGSVERRLGEKRRRSDTKRGRRPSHGDDS